MPLRLRARFNLSGQGARNGEKENEARGRETDSVDDGPFGNQLSRPHADFSRSTHCPRDRDFNREIRKGFGCKTCKISIVRIYTQRSNVSLINKHFFSNLSNLISDLTS